MSQQTCKRLEGLYKVHGRIFCATPLEKGSIAYIFNIQPCRSCSDFYEAHFIFPDGSIHFHPGILFSLGVFEKIG